ncbi:esterase/lipase family protein [Streptomyces noursei]|uniref:esterase/lipase family protein n=1 Tax=Streptomyces noursei TaxID=1971 RepID=UPI00199837D3|nr:alpha/beta fold hydrolase [Streptomyces noursei]MCZ1013169.1 alpha/beta fold hydrolase [Streptomyces noursei]GGX27438.1 lipase [Streptomyces noursei]
MKLRWSRLLTTLPAVALAAGLTTSPVAAAHPPATALPGKPLGLPLPTSFSSAPRGPLGLPLLKSSATGTPRHAPWAAPVSSGWNDFSCRPSARHPRPVVLVHGTLANAVDNWLGLAPYLVARGYCVFSLTYGQLPGLPLVGGLGPIDDSARQLAVFVDRVRAATDSRKVDMVGQSQGGMMPRVYMKFHGGRHKVHTLVGLAPDNHGTDLYGLATLVDIAPIKQTLHTLTPGLIQQKAGSPLLRRLNAGGDTLPGIRYTVIATRYDEVVTPLGSEFLHGPRVHNILIQHLCPVDVSMHASIGLIDRIAFHETANALDPAHAIPTTCASALS